MPETRSLNFGLSTKLALVAKGTVLAEAQCPGFNIITLFSLAPILCHNKLERLDFQVFSANLTFASKMGACLSGTSQCLTRLVE